MADAGQRSFARFAPGSDIARDIPRYRVYKDGLLAEEPTDVARYFAERDDLVSFLIGCSFSFESALLEADIPVRQIEEGVNVPMYNTNIPCESAGVFHGNMVVSMRPIPHKLVPAAVAITAGMPRVHGAPVQIGFPEAIGITDLAHPRFRRCRHDPSRGGAGLLALRGSPPRRRSWRPNRRSASPTPGAHVSDRREEHRPAVLTKEAFCHALSGSQL